MKHNDAGLIGALFAIFAGALGVFFILMGFLALYLIVAM